MYSLKIDRNIGSCQLVVTPPMFQCIHSKYIEANAVVSYVATSRMSLCSHKQYIEIYIPGFLIFYTIHKNIGGVGTN